MANWIDFIQTIASVAFALIVGGYLVSRYHEEIDAAVNHFYAFSRKGKRRQ